MELVDAVAEMIRREVARVDDPVTGVPGGDPSDVAGWFSHHPDHPRPPGAPGTPYFDAEAWRWFELVDVAWLDGEVLVKFRWAEPGAPDLSYLAAYRVAPWFVEKGTRTATMVVRMYLRTVLAPLDAPPDAVPDGAPGARRGWRHRVLRTWISADTVLVAPPPRWPPPTSAAERQAERDARW